MSNVRCLACGHIFDRALEMCPRRYLSPHDEETMGTAAKQLEIWAKLFCATPEQMADHMEGCLRCVHDVRGQPSRADEERAARALSVCQTKFCLGNLPPPIRCVMKE